MPDPSPHITDPSSLCSLLFRPQLMTGTLRDIVIQHFQEDNIEEVALRNLIWRPGDTTGILVETAHRWKPQTAGKMPAVVIKRNTCANRRVGVNDKVRTDTRAEEHFATYWAGSHTLFCIGTEGAQVELLATEVTRELLQFGPLLRRDLDLVRFQVNEMGPVSELAESNEHFVVPVTVGYVYEERWSIRKQAPKLSIHLSILMDC